MRFRELRWQREHRSEPGYRKWSADVLPSTVSVSAQGFTDAVALSGNEGVGDSRRQTISWSATTGIQNGHLVDTRTTNDSHHRDRAGSFSAFHPTHPVQRPAAACARNISKICRHRGSLRAWCAKYQRRPSMNTSHGVFLDSASPFLFAFVKANVFQNHQPPSATSTPSV